ncbi:hypothetical protein BKA62DRAFT_622482 [Auriculariales sp. MPI-PUGE-AT-0066]|nr:hypothetical protein BKA62DRAFT_622482 [Auriculariales sp. MPI-PUGE-AT-0066]
MLTNLNSVEQNSPLPTEIYDGGMVSDAATVRLRIGNGGAGQAGLVGALANQFIRDAVQHGNVSQPFLVAWFLGDTFDTINNLADGRIDIGITYCPSAERRLLTTGVALERRYAFRDHFLLVGPRSNPAGVIKGEDIYKQFHDIVRAGNEATVPATKFLSRYDKSATNIKESEIFIAIGQVPWAHSHARWYHQFTDFPRQALVAAANLEEYTLTNRDAALSAAPDVLAKLEIYGEGKDEDPHDPLLNPAAALLGAKARDMDMARLFLDWLVRPDGGQLIIRTFERNGHIIYSPAPAR